MIEYKNVVKEYPNGVLATDHISLKIEQGEFVYVVGPSGAGKSTFIKKFRLQVRLKSTNMNLKK